MGFAERVQQAVLLFRERVKQGPVLLVGNLDTDGVTALSLLVHAFQQEGLPFCVTFVQQVNDVVLHELRSLAYQTLFFVDLGSSSLPHIVRHLEGKSVFVFDHHKPEPCDVPEWIVHLNPSLDGIDGTKDISAAGISYLFVRALTGHGGSLAHLALIGSVGDAQEEGGFVGLNKDILRDALECGSVEVREGLRMYGVYTKPLVQVLEYCVHPYIPGVTGSRRGAVQFLEDHHFARGGRVQEVRLADLRREDVHRFLAALHIDSDGKMFGPVYLLPSESADTPFYDVREYSTLLNACCRLGKAGVGIGVCLGDVGCRKHAREVLEDYRRELIDALQWFHHHRGTERLIERKGFTILMAGDDLRDTLTGTLASLIGRSGIYPDRTLIMSMAHTLGDEVKVSLRTCGHHPDIDLRAIVQELAVAVGGSGGGHCLAAGATIPREKVDVFLRGALDTLGRYAAEQYVTVP